MPSTSAPADTSTPDAVRSAAMTHRDMAAVRPASAVPADWPSISSPTSSGISAVPTPLSRARIGKYSSWALSPNITA